ncbi:helix-turn-helix domain-containing protein [Populibacterium corticicola]|uniref:Helix-turn-helix domain-containing protein n=1 Tax=Populibacterium corticicola TaxID=1812826 RepID=A0ABW5XBT1_9MICO
MPPANKRWTDIHDSELATLHAENLGVRAIAERMGFGRTTISTNAKRLGLTFDRRQTRAATAAIQADAKAKRAALELKLLEDAERLRSQLWQPHTYIDHGGKDYVKVTWTQEEPSPSDKLKLMQAASAALDRSIKITQLDSDNGAAGAISMLEGLAKQLGVTGPQDDETP